MAEPIDLLGEVRKGQRDGLHALRDLLATAIDQALNPKPITGADGDLRDRAPKPEAVASIARVLVDVLAEIEGLSEPEESEGAAIQDARADLLAGLPDPTGLGAQRGKPRSRAGRGSRTPA